MIWFLFLVGCSATDGFRDGWRTTDTSEEHAEACPSDMVLVQGMLYEVGASPGVMAELDPDGNSVISRIPLVELEVADFCISTWPFPGLGRAWPADGLNLAMAKAVDEWLAEFGRRLSTLGEVLVATATITNDRWPSGAGSWAEANCDPNPYKPSAIGAYSKCVSRFGVGGLLTFAFWAAFDDATYAALEAINLVPPDPTVGYALIGGMPDWWEAFYGDDLYGYHCHGEEEPYDDDRGILTVAEPYSVTDEEQAKYEVGLDAFEAAGNTWEALLGE